MHGGVNYVQFGRQRDDKIVELVYRGTAFTRTQVQALIFKQKDAKRKAQLRLRVLTKQGRISQYIRSPHEPAVYYHGRRVPGNLDHTLLLNDVYVAAMVQKKSYFTVAWHWEYPILGKIRADAMIDIYDQLAKRRHVVFVEVERYADHRFSKDKSYDLIASMDWVMEKWAIIDSTRILFPAILVVTDTKLDIKSKLDFFVAPVSAIKQDIYSIILRR